MIRERLCPGIAALLLAVLLRPCQGAPLSVDDDNPAQETRLWEIGLFNGAAWLPPYRGSDEHSTYFLPLPYFVYRGEVFRSGRDGVKGIFFRSGRLQSDVSMSGTPPVPRNNEARDGMPYRGALGEIGPALRYSLLPPNSLDSLYLRGSVRAAMSLNVYDNMQSSSEGFRGVLDLVYDNRTFLESRKVRFGGSVAADYMSREYCDFYYGVARQYETDARSHYRARGGYGGFSVSGYITKDLTKRISIAAYASWANVSGASFADSPLVRDENNLTLACALTWQLLESSKPVPPRH
jgi:MipA family protein